MPASASSPVARSAPRERTFASAASVPTERLARARALDAEIASLHRQNNVNAARIAAQLALLEQSRGFVELGFGSLAAYALARLGWGQRKLVEMLRLVLRLEGLPLLREAFQNGQLDWTKAVIAARAAQKAPESEARWLEEAQTHDCRRLEREAAALLGEEPRVRLTFELSPAEAALLFEGFRALESEHFPDRRREAKLVELARRALHGGAVGGTSFRVLLEHCPDCRRTVQPTGREELPVSAAASERILCDAELQDAAGRVSRTVPPKLRNLVLARSKGRCEVPGCTNRAHLELHHNKGWRSGHDLDSLFHLCSTHHTAPHEGRLRIEGTWSAGVRFLLADGTLLGSAGGSEPPPGPPHAGPSVVPDEPRVAAAATDRRLRGGAAPADTRASAPAATVVGPVLAVPLTTAGTAKDSERRLALKALEKLELSAREARLLLDRALEERPELRAACASELVRAALLCHSP